MEDSRDSGAVRLTTLSITGSWHWYRRHRSTETALLNVLSDTPWNISATATAKNVKLNGTSWSCVVLALWWLSVPPSGRGQDHATHFRILHPLKYLWNGLCYSLQISNTSWPRKVLSFVLFWISKPRDRFPWLSPKWAWSGSRDPFLHHGSRSYLSSRWS